MNRIVFKTPEERKAQLRIRLFHDNLKQSEFFKLILRAYIAGDQRISQIINEYKTASNVKEKKKMITDEILKKKGQQVIDHFALDDTQIDSIFDLIAEELEEY
jgi:hypothetical protein